MTWEDYLGLLLVIIITCMVIGAFALVLRVLWFVFLYLWHLIPV